MSQYEQASADTRLTTTFRALANGRRRRLLGLVQDRSPAEISTENLATALAEWTREQSAETVTETNRDAHLAEIHHVHLPMLEEAHFLSFDVERGVATARPDSEPMDPTIRESCTEAGAAARSLDSVFEALSDSRRRVALGILEREEELPLDALASAVAAAETRAGAESGEPPADRVALSLVHADVPALAEADLVAYDAASDLVAYRDHPAVRSRWIGPAVRDDRPDPSAGVEAGSAGAGTSSTASED